MSSNTITASFTRVSTNVPWPAQIPWSLGEPQEVDTYIEQTYKNTGKLAVVTNTYSEDQLNLSVYLEFDTNESLAQWVNDELLNSIREIRNQYCLDNRITYTVTRPS